MPGMTATEVDFQSTNSKPFGFEPRVVDFLFMPKFRKPSENSFFSNLLGLKSASRFS
jgi:hypothetical protein